MESTAIYALIENIKILNGNIEKITNRIEVLEGDFKERTIKKRLMRSLIAFYPLVLVSLIWVINADHESISRVAADVSELIKDSQSINPYARSNDD
jgi:hypothetical protein